MAHCTSEARARTVLEAIARRMAEVGLELYPDKTRIVYCKDSDRTGSYEHEQFTFLWPDPRELSHLTWPPFFGPRL